MKTTYKKTAPSRTTEENSAPADKLVCFRKVNDLTGSRCQTSHNARQLAARGLIRAVRFNERTIRFSLESVLAFVAGKASA
jgi:hypothetical protein